MSLSRREWRERLGRRQLPAEAERLQARNDLKDDAYHDVDHEIGRTIKSIRRKHRVSRAIEK